MSRRTEKPACQPRAKLPTELPLDDRARDGTEAWREIQGVRFCHWDRWLLRLALTEQDGLPSIAREFRRRVRAQRSEASTAEAMLAQISDLEARLEQLTLAPKAVLDAEERESTWLKDKAFRRVWHAASIRKTPAMQRTPRIVLHHRALSGNWNAFPVSPAPFAAELKAAIGDGYYDYRGTDVAVTVLQNMATRILSSAISNEDRLATHRAMLSVAIAAMEQVDDSLAQMAEHFREHERSYLQLLRLYANRPGLLRDLLELVIWEDYGLFSEVDDFLLALPEEQANLGVIELARIIAELRAAELDYQLSVARRLRHAIVAAADTVGSLAHGPANQS